MVVIISLFIWFFPLRLLYQPQLCFGGEVLLAWNWRCIPTALNMASGPRNGHSCLLSPWCLVAYIKTKFKSETLYFLPSPLLNQGEAHHYIWRVAKLGWRPELSSFHPLYDVPSEPFSFVPMVVWACFLSSAWSLPRKNTVHNTQAASLQSHVAPIPLVPPLQWVPR